MYNYRTDILDGENIMFDGDEIFGTRNKRGLWDLEVTGIESDSNGNSYERKLIIKDADIKIEISRHEPPTFTVMADYLESKTTQIPQY